MNIKDVVAPEGYKISVGVPGKDKRNFIPIGGKGAFSIRPWISDYHNELVGWFGVWKSFS